MARRSPPTSRKRKRAPPPLKLLPDPEDPKGEPAVCLRDRTVVAFVLPTPAQAEAQPDRWRLCAIADLGDAPAFPALPLSGGVDEVLRDLLPDSELAMLQPGSVAREAGYRHVHVGYCSAVQGPHGEPPVLNYTASALAGERLFGTVVFVRA